jgi:NADPH2:quinone reductase
MRAIVVRRFGAPDVLQLEEVPDPVPAAGQVLVRLRAAGVNPVETYIRSGTYRRLPPLPYIPGSDGAGDVLAVGEGITSFRPGDRVYVAGAPTYADLVAAPAEAVWPLPDHLTYEQGAAIGIPYRTAYLAVHLVGEARPDDWVLVRGGSGGVGIATIQLAVAHGCRVVATAGSEEGRALCLAQGALAALSHDDAPGLLAVTGGRGYDLIVEMLANANLASDLTLVAERGRVAVVGSRGRIEIDPRDLMMRSSSVRGVYGMTPEERRRIHAALGAGLRNRTLVPVVGRRFPLAEAAAAHEAVLSAGARGKVVLTMDSGG